jgi:hypothetical protein
MSMRGGAVGVSKWNEVGLDWWSGKTGTIGRWFDSTRW